MMRDDTIKRLMRARKPAPTPVFNDSVLKTLTLLPERKHTFVFSSVLRFVPTAAVVVACVAVVGLAIAYSGTGGKPGQNNPLAAGLEATGQETATAIAPEATLEATPNEQQQFFQLVNASCTENGITETVLEAGAYGLALRMKIKAGPFQEYTSPSGKTKVIVNGTETSFDCVRPVGGDAWEGDSNAGYCTYTVYVPILNEISGENVMIELVDEFNLPSDLYIDNEQEEDALTFTKVTTKISFSIPVYKPVKLSASANGLIAFGNEVSVESVFSSINSMIYTLNITDNQAGDLQRYLEENTNAEGVSKKRFDPEEFGIVVCTRLVDKEFVKSFKCLEEINLMRSAGDAKADGIIGVTLMNLAKVGDGEFRLMIATDNTDINPNTDVTIITKNSSGYSDVSYALQVSILGVAENPAVKSTPAPQTTALPGQETPMQTPMPETTSAPGPEITSMPAENTQFMQALNLTCTNNGYTQKVIEAGTDGYMLYVKFQRVKEPEGKYSRDLKVLVDGAENVNCYAGNGDADTWSVKIPLTVMIQNSVAKIELAYTLIDPSTKHTAGEALAEFKFAFDLPVYNPRKAKLAPASGSVALDNAAKLIGIYQSMDTSIYRLRLTDNMDGDLEKYYAKLSSGDTNNNNNSSGKVLLETDDFAFAICKGLVSKDYIDQYTTNDRFKLALTVGDGDGFGHGIYTRFLFMVLQKHEDGSFVLNIINMNPTYQPTSNFTIITKMYSYNSDGTVSNDNNINYALQIKQG